MFFIFSEFGSISEASSGQNRIPRAVFMLADGLELTGGAWRIDFYMNEEPCEKYAAYVDPGLYLSTLHFQPINDSTS